MVASRRRHHVVKIALGIVDILLLEYLTIALFVGLFCLISVGNEDSHFLSTSDKLFVVVFCSIDAFFTSLHHLCSASMQCVVPNNATKWIAPFLW
jgi:hypothetical protein